ncbi:hypothetical protein BAE44_0011719 [Dichanthelium oligosanthes]|uniref:Bifunctional inhibitor/plant lipid transfer protein/seed storage helical domain-containing protein n=1 Tax=Dichanthelium oligosanthes TaxID=888268 RepID=A0A1E5VQ95_9POAL|nr:hypothetical protein BAE44_0011719 [Dichanthelium oligosanthes]
MGPTAARLLPLLLVAASATSLLPTPASAADAPASTSAASAYAAARDAATRCAATIVSISPCLPHVAAVAPPLASSPPAPTDACCIAFLRAVYPSAGGGGGGGEGCLCHLLRNPLLLGFPIDAARLGALLPACAAGNSFAAATVEAATLFADACRGERAASPRALLSSPLEPWLMNPLPCCLTQLKALPELHVTPQSTAWPEISPAAAVPESVSKPMEAVPPAGSFVRSGAEASRSRSIPIAALILAAAAVVT